MMDRTVDLTSNGIGLLDALTAPLPSVAAQAMFRIEQALTAPDAETVAKVNAALGLRTNRKPNAHLGETATYLTVWSQMDLDDIFRRVGGTVTIRQVERSNHDGEGTWSADEITLTVDVPDVGYVEVVTDIEDDPEHGYRTDVPVVKAARAVTRHESAFPAATAELHRVERTVAGLHAGESAVVNGTTVTAVSLAVAEAVTRYEVAVGRRAEIEAKPAREWSGAEFDSWARCEAVIVDSLTVLVEADSVDLVEVEDDSPFLAAARYRTAKALARKLGNAALDPELSDLDADSLAHAEDVMDGLRAALAKAGMLRLIGGGR